MPLPHWRRPSRRARPPAAAVLIARTPSSLGRLAALLVLLIAACAPPTPPRQTASDTIVIAIPQEPEHLFAPAATSAEAQAVLGTLTAGLTVETDAGEVEPILAERVPSLENGDAFVAATPDGRGALTVRFRLRENARWHDGSPLRASDVRFGWLLLSNRDAPIPAYNRGAASRIHEVRAVDERTVEVVYRVGERDPVYALCCNGFVLPEAHLRDVPLEKLKESAFARSPTYAGPFRFKEQRRTGIVLERSPHYVLEPAKFERVSFVFLPDPDVALGELAARRIDVATAGLFGTDRAADLATLDRLGVRTIITPSLALEHLDFNLRDPADIARRHPILGDHRVRAAIAAAIDRGAIAREATAGRLNEAESYLLPPSWAAADPTQLARYPHDRAEAQRLLEEAGWKRDADDVRARDGVRLHLRMVVASGSRPRDRAALRIADDLGRVGVEVAVEPVPTARLTASPPTGPLSGGGFDLALYAWVGNRDPAPWSILYHHAQIPTAVNAYVGQNYPGWSDDAFSRLADEAANSLERDPRRDRYLEMQRIWTQALPALPLYQRVQVDAVDARLREVRPLPTRQPLTWNIARWSLGGI